MNGATHSAVADLVNGTLPDEKGRFGAFGGRFVPETLMPAVIGLEQAAREAFEDATFQTRLQQELRDWVGRPTPITFANGLSEQWDTEVFLKREDLTHTGAHKINNAIGQALLARRMGARRVIAETGAGQHGVATAAACARVGLPCTVYMGAVDVARQQPNAHRIQQLGADLVPVTSGDQTLRAAIDEAIRDWVTHPADSYYLIGSVVGPHPYPWMVRQFQRVIGDEAARQLPQPPELVVACVGGGSNAIGLFHAFLDTDATLLGVEAAGAATVSQGSPGVLHGAESLLLQNEDGQIQETHSISAGLDYPGVGPEHSYLRAAGRVRYESVADQDALAAALECNRTEGIFPALESAHALAGARRFAAEYRPDRVLVGLSGRGDKDLATYMDQS